MNIVIHRGLRSLFWDFGSSTADRSRSSFEILLLDVLGLGSLYQKHPDALISGRCKSWQIQYFQTGFFERSGIFNRKTIPFSIDPRGGDQSHAEYQNSMQFVIGLRFSSSVINFVHWVADTGSHSVLAARVGCHVSCGSKISIRYTRALQFSCLFLK